MSQPPSSQDAGSSSQPSLSAAVDALPEAVFVAGRQHSGNTLLTVLLGRIDGCFAIEEEGIFFEHQPLLAKRVDIVERGRWIASNLKLNDDALTHAVVEHMVAWSTEHAGTAAADPLAQYREAMRFLTEKTGNSFWAQKGTSYIFYAQRILRDMPHAKFVYLIRNPFDVCASKRRREPNQERIFGWAVSWNKGVQLAQRLKDDFVDRVLLIRYEDLVSEPEAVVRQLCEFVGKTFDPRYLDVPHINPSEKKYQVVEGSKGINKSRLYYYREHLPPREVAALDMLIDGELVRRFYPELPHEMGRSRLLVKLAAVALIIKGPFHYLVNKYRFNRKHGAPMLTRTLHRLRLK